MTKRLFIEETTPGATSPGVREVFEPSDAEMAELGWVRMERVRDAADFIVGEPPIPDLVAPTNGHADTDAIDDPDDDARAVSGVVRPCPEHTAATFGCARCAAWDSR